MSIVKRRGGCVCLRLTAFCVQILWQDQVSTLPTTTTCACSVGYCVMTSGKVFRDVIFRYSRRKDTGATHGRHATRYVPWVPWVKGHRGPGTGTQVVAQVEAPGTTSRHAAHRQSRSGARGGHTAVPRWLIWNNRISYSRLDTLLSLWRTKKVPTESYLENQWINLFVLKPL